MTFKQINIPTTYFGNIEFYWLLYKSDHVIIDNYEVYQKQSFRNRTVILTANGPHNLSLPVTRPHGKNTIIKDIELSYAENWTKDHVRALEAAYRNSPYYEFYADGIFQILKREHKYLHELNLELILYLTSKIGLSTKLESSTESLKITDLDFRKTLHPKLASNLSTYHYIQNFEERHGFYPNPSIVDLLFNEGPNAISILQESKPIILL